MPANKKPRKRYKPADPELRLPVAQFGDYLGKLALQNSSALTALTQGRATTYDMNILVAMYNITLALRELGKGAEYEAETLQGRLALVGIAHRAKTIKRFTPTGPEIQALNRLMELHDAQMEIIKALDVQKAIWHAKSRKHDTAYLHAVSNF